MSSLELKQKINLHIWDAPPPPSVSTEFLDPVTQKTKVCTRESFVGRRRQLQNCLKRLTQSTEEIGVLIHGMGGLGKSSLAARLCDRLPTFQRVVLVGRIDEPSLVSRLVEKLDDNEQRKQLQNPDEELKFRLKRVFQQLPDAGEKPFLLVLDDFEVNLEPRQDSFVLKTAAAEVLTALVWAIRETYTNHRLILTCRYDFEFSKLQYFYKQPLEGMRGADLRKKCNRLQAFKTSSQVDENLKSQAKRLADGNPRLLEWLDKILQAEPHPLTPSPQARMGDKSVDSVDVVAILNRLEVDAVELREQVLADVLLQQMDETMQEMLTLGLVFELPVPREALTAVCEHIPNLADYINRAVALGLLEVSPDQSLRVPRILPLKLPTNLETLHQQAAEVLYRLWWEEAESSTEEEKLEIHRLALLGKQGEIASEVGTILANNWINKSRFRETLHLCKSTLDTVESYTILGNLARSEKELGEIEQAQQHYQQALELCPAKDEKDKAAIIHNLAIIYANTGKIDNAIALYQQSLKIEEGINNVQGKASTLHGLANIYANTGKIDDAITLYQQSLQLTEDIGDVQGQAATLHGLANIYADIGKIDDAITLYQQSLQLTEGIGDVKTKAATLHQLAIIYANTGKIDNAITLYQQSLEFTEDIGDVQGKAATLHQLANLYANTEKTNDAITLYQQSLEIKESIGDIQGQAITLAMLGQLLADEKGNFVTALEYLQQSLEILQRIQSPDAETVRGIINRIQNSKH
ncbi:tetratricopeptide repeat protein [Richelia sinica]|uniref:tetratricopeptide repeat protein n=1 Tax=Richelia sinica TaxID=1357545 RepID=UPI00300CCA15